VESIFVTWCSGDLPGLTAPGMYCRKDAPVWAKDAPHLSDSGLTKEAIWGLLALSHQLLEG
jgi:hypothetical protein